MANWIKRRNWIKTSIEPIGTLFAICLDETHLLTPKKNKVLVPTQRLAFAVAEEWDRQRDIIEPSEMPYSRLANSAIDRVKANFDSIVQDLASYGDTDLLCYRAEVPEELVLLQKRLWDPILIWAKSELGIQLKVNQGVIYKSQNIAQREKIFQEISSYDNFMLTGFYDLVTISGSVLVALAVHRNFISPEEGIDISFLDEDWQRQKWGEDEESTVNKSNKLTDFQTAYNFLTLLA